jgi:hypothetical protein
LSGPSSYRTPPSGKSTTLNRLSPSHGEMKYCVILGRPKTENPCGGGSIPSLSTPKSQQAKRLPGLLVYWGGEGSKRRIRQKPIRIPYSHGWCCDGTNGSGGQASQPVLRFRLVPSFSERAAGPLQDSVSSESETSAGGDVSLGINGSCDNITPIFLGGQETFWLKALFKWGRVICNSLTYDWLTLPTDVGRS